MVKSEMVLSSAIDAVRKIAVAGVQLEMTQPKRRNHSLAHIVRINENNIGFAGAGTANAGTPAKNPPAKSSNEKTRAREQVFVKALITCKTLSGV